VTPLILAAALAGGVVNIRVDTALAHRISAIRPFDAIGAGVDSDPRGKVPLLYAPARTALALPAGLGRLSYRLYTELSVQDWHWNTRGAFSDASRAEGYWTSDATIDRPPLVDSFGYRLPHRGDTRDQGDDDGYSVIDDGDPRTYWKSDPYLAQRYTHERDVLHPQWIVVDLLRPAPIDAIRIAWANPYATRYAVQYWTGPDAIAEQGLGTWHTFASGEVATARAGTVTTRLTSSPVTARFVRVVMSESSNTCDTHDRSDPRNCLGYAIRELWLGRLDAAGRFVDVIHHSRCGGDPADRRRCARHQTPIYVSSVDPWHRAGDRVRSDQDQPSLDTVARSGFARGRAVIYPVPLFYSTPENALAEIRYLRARRLPIAYIELGEEVDGQYATPEDYGALYVQWARALHAVDPSLHLGGPVFMGWNEDVATWRNEDGDVSWLHRFLRYLKRRHALDQLAFMSFEHYPFHGCDDGAALREDLLREPSLMRNMAAIWRADGLPSGIPMFITEANFSADGCPVAQRIEGALWMADWIGSALSSGIMGINYYQYEAEPLNRSERCGRYGAYGMFVTGSDFRIRARAAQFYAAQMLTRYWLAFGEAPSGIYPASSDEPPARAEIGAYAARRPDGEWSVLLVNKDFAPREIALRFAHASGGASIFGGRVAMTVFGRSQYGWRGTRRDELPAPDDPPRTSVLAGGLQYLLPAESIVVLRGTVRADGRR